MPPQASHYPWLRVFRLKHRRGRQVGQPAEVTPLEPPLSSKLELVHTKCTGEGESLVEHSVGEAYTVLAYPSLC